MIRKWPFSYNSLTVTSFLKFWFYFNPGQNQFLNIEKVIWNKIISLIFSLINCDIGEETIDACQVFFCSNSICYYWCWTAIYLFICDVYPHYMKHCKPEFLKDETEAVAQCRHKQTTFFQQSLPLTLIQWHLKSWKCSSFWMQIRT